jgi:transposase
VQEYHVRVVKGSKFPSSKRHMQPSSGLRSTYCFGIRSALDCHAGGQFLAPYSPDFNPIENAFAKFKALLRRADAIAQAIATFSPPECANYFAAAGYDAD